MANSKLKTIWTLNGRAPDSRDVFDKNSIGLRVGRIDIPASATVNVEGYSKVEYQVHLSDGTVESYGDFQSLITAWTGTIESKTGSGFMTVFLQRLDSDALGMIQIDVYKEWEDADPEPEPAEDVLASASKRSYGSVFGISLMSTNNSVTNVMFDGNDINRTLDKAYKFRKLSEDYEALVKRVEALEAKPTE